MAAVSSGPHLKSLPVRERSPSRSSSSPPDEGGLVGMEVWITGPTSLPPRRSNKSLACENSRKGSPLVQADEQHPNRKGRPERIYLK